MSLILDTHAFFWWVTNSPKLTPQAQSAIADEGGSCFISAVSLFEMSNKVRLGKFEAAREIVDRIDGVLADNEFLALSVTMEHARLAGQLSDPHRDPFDRLLAAQAIVEGMTIITADIRIKDLGAKVVW